MSERIVLFPMRLLLEDVKRSADGDLLGGDVVNGGWRLAVTETEMQCFDHFRADRPVTRYPRCDFHEIAVPASVGGDYNAVIAWAEWQAQA